MAESGIMMCWDPDGKAMAASYNMKFVPYFLVPDAENNTITLQCACCAGHKLSIDLYDPESLQMIYDRVHSGCLNVRRC